MFTNQSITIIRVSTLVFALLVLGFLSAGISEAKTIKLKPIKDAKTENLVINIYKQARSAYKAGKKVQARLLLKKAASYDQTAMSAYIHELLSRIYHDLGNPNDAAKEALISLRYNPNQESILFNLGIYCQEANRYDEAIAFLNQYKRKVSGQKRKRALSLIGILEEARSKAKKFPANSGDYLNKLTTEDNVNRWPKNKFPLKVFIEPASRAKGFQAGFPKLAKDAFISWYRASGRKTALKFINSKDSADISLFWTDKRLRTDNDKRERMKAGLTTSRTTISGEIIKATIQVRTLNPFSKRGTKADQVKETCLHEIGHALGLNGHSTNQSDIMYLGTTKRQLPALTKRDKATIAKLYHAYKTKEMPGVAKVAKSKVHTGQPKHALQTGHASPHYPQRAAAPMYRQSPVATQPGVYYVPVPVPVYVQTPRAMQPVQPTTQYTPLTNQQYQVVNPYYRPSQPVYAQPGFRQTAPPQAYMQQPLGYNPPVIPRQIPSPYAVPQVGNYQQVVQSMPTNQPAALGSPGQNNQVPQALKMIDNIFTNLKPKIDQFMNSNNQAPSPNMQMQGQSQIQGTPNNQNNFGFGAP